MSAGQSLDAVELKELRKIVGLDPLIDFIELTLGNLDKMLFAILCSKPNHVRLDTGGIIPGSKVAPCASACIPLSRLPSKIGRAIINASAFFLKTFASREGINEGIRGTYKQLRRMSLSHQSAWSRSNPHMSYQAKSTS